MTTGPAATAPGADLPAAAATSIAAPPAAGTRPAEPAATGVVVDVPAGLTAREEERRARASQSFWTMVVGVPAIFSVLRLGVEAGGELQTTLLLVANVGPANLIAAMVTTAAPLVSAGLVVVFAIGTVLAVSVDAHQPELRRQRRPIFARWTEATPAWFVVAGFGLAIITWQVLYLPLLLPAIAAAFQLTPRRVHRHPAVRALVVAAALLGYAWLVSGTVRDAWGQREILVVLLFAAPPVLALFVAGPVPAITARPLAVIAQPAVLAVLLWTALPVITTPVLPMTVTTVATDSAGHEDVRGHVIAVDDVHTVILQERGGVRYVPVDRIEDQVLCPTAGELPRYRLRLRDFHIEDSLLEGLGRQVRPVTRIAAACRSPLVG